MEEDLPSLSILIIDNEQHIVDIVIEMLREHICHGSTNIDDAIDMLQENRYDFILCDIIMPIKGGKDLLQYCEQNMPNLLPKLIFMTGGTIALKTDNCFQKYPMIQKPFRMQVLLSCIAQMTQRETT
jgi:DNA-binding NtrC family response regulator